MLLLQCYQNLKAILQTPFKNISFNNSLVLEIEKRIVYFQEMPKSGRGLYPNGLALFLPGNGPIGPLHADNFCNAKICSVLDLHLAAMAI